MPLGIGWVSVKVVSPFLMVGPMVTVESGVITPSCSAPLKVMIFATEPASTVTWVAASIRDAVGDCCHCCASKIG